MSETSSRVRLRMKAAKVNAIFTGFGGICVEISE